MSDLLRRCRLSFLCLCALIFSVVAPAGAASPLTAEEAYSAAALAPGETVTIKILVTITAPASSKKETRLPVSVSLVIDRSGSMEEAKKLVYAVRAGKILVNALEKQDRFGLIIYDTNVNELYPLSPVQNKQAVIKLLDGIKPGGTTFLSGGLEAGIKQLRADTSRNGRRLILLSDGLANKGVTNPELVAAIGARARPEGMNISTIGLGLDYDETLMQLLAQRGGGKYYYVKDSEDLPGVLREELALATESATRNLTAAFTPSAAVTDVAILGYSTRKDDGVRHIDMGDFQAGEKRQIMVRLACTPEKGEQRLGSLRLAYTGADDDAFHILDIPLALTVEADAKAREEANAAMRDSVRTVNEEFLLLEAEEAHVAAMVALEQGKKEEARKIMQSASQSLAAAPTSKAAVNKQAALQRDEANLEAAARDMALQKSMVKGAKSSAYQSGMGTKQGVMLQKGDKGFLVEKLQNALAAKGFYKGEINGEYSVEVEEAVRAFQKANALDSDGVAGQLTQRALGM